MYRRAPAKVCMMFLLFFFKKTHLIIKMLSVILDMLRIISWILCSGKTTWTGEIRAGSWSREGSTTAQPMNDDSAILGVCPKGYYCPTGSEIYTPCPTGTYGFSRQLGSVGECTNCLGGHYCPSTNMTSSGPECTAGYYCSRASPVPDPVNATYGDECPTGTWQCRW